jgi:hypothetical protein
MLNVISCSYINAIGIDEDIYLNTDKQGNNIWSSSGEGVDIMSEAQIVFHSN